MSKHISVMLDNGQMVWVQIPDDCEVVWPSGLEAIDVTDIESIAATDDYEYDIIVRKIEDE